MGTNKLLTDLKKNYGFYVLLFTISGSAYQFFNLARVSPSAIKFFSVSSAISDTIILIANVIIIFISISIARILISVLIFQDFGILITNFQSKKKIVLFGRRFELYIFLTVFLICLITELILSFPKYSQAKNILTYIYFVYFLTIIYILIFEKIPRYIKANDSADLQIYFVLLGFVTLLIFSFINPIQILAQNRIHNFKRYEDNIKTKYDVDLASIEYFNDKYIFVEAVKFKDENTLIIIESIDQLIQDK